MTKLYYAIFGGTILLVISGIIIYSQIQEGEMEKLSQKFPDWIVVRGGAAPFRALFPREPRTEESETPVPNSDIVLKQKVYVAEVPLDMTYALSTVVYPSSVGGDLEENLRDSLNGMMPTLPDGELMSSRMVVPLSGEKSLEFLIHRKEMNSYLKGRLLLKDAVLYQYWVTYGEDRYQEDAYTYFVNSFHPSSE